MLSGTCIKTFSIVIWLKIGLDPHKMIYQKIRKSDRARLNGNQGRFGFVMKRRRLRVSGGINLGQWAAIFVGIYFIPVKSLKNRVKRAFSCQKMQLLRKPCSQPLQTSFGIHQLRKQNFPIDFCPTFGDWKNQSWSTRGDKEIQYPVRQTKCDL